MLPAILIFTGRVASIVVSALASLVGVPILASVSPSTTAAVSIIVVVSVGALCAFIVAIGLILAVNFAEFDSFGSDCVNGVFVIEFFTHIFGGIIVSINNTIEEVGLLEWIRDIEV